MIPFNGPQAIKRAEENKDNHLTFITMSFVVRLKTELCINLREEGFVP